MQKTQNRRIANIDVETTTEVIDGVDLDTEVMLFGNVYVSGSERDKFITEFEALITKYRI